MGNIAIVAVDDEKIILDSIKIQLESKYGSKYIYEFAESAEEALDVIGELTSEQIKLLLVISDYLMPGMKGDEFVKKLKTHFHKVNIVMLTGQITTDISEELIEQNIILKLIEKPWKESDLFSIIDSLKDHE